MEIREISNCCGARIIENTDLCSKCGEHCEIIDEEVDRPLLGRNWITEDPDFSLFRHWKDDDDHPELHVSEG